MKGPTTYSKREFPRSRTSRTPGSCYCKGTAKPNKYFSPCPQILQTWKNFIARTSISWYPNALRKNLRGNTQYWKYFSFLFTVQGHTYNSVKVLHNLRTLVNFQYIQPLHISRSVLSLWVKRLHIAYKIIINWDTLCHKMSNNSPLLWNRPGDVKFYGGVQTWSR